MQDTPDILTVTHVAFGLTGGHYLHDVDGPDFIWPVMDLRFLDASFDEADARILLTIPRPRDLSDSAGSILEAFRANAAAALRAAADLLDGSSVPELEALGRALSDDLPA